MALGNRMQQSELIVVKIEQVDLPNRIVHVRDKTNSPLMAAFRESAGGILRIPAPDEKWTAKRVGTTWRLESKLDSLSDHQWTAANLSTGDTRIDADGTVHILGEEIRFNEHPLGTTTYAAFTADGTSKAYTLLESPLAADSIQAFVNGLLVDPRTFTLNGPVVTFSVAPAAGTLIIYYQRAGETEGSEGFGSDTYGTSSFG